METANQKVTYEVEEGHLTIRGIKYSDYRVNKYLNGKWVNQRDGRWSKDIAESIANEYRKATAKGFCTMSDNF